MITALNQQIWQIEKKFSLQFSVETVYSSDPSWMRSEPFLLPRHHLACNCSRGVFNTVSCFQCSVWDLFATLSPPTISLSCSSTAADLAMLLSSFSTDAACQHGASLPGRQKPAFLAAVHVRWPPLSPLPFLSPPGLGACYPASLRQLHWGLQDQLPCKPSWGFRALTLLDFICEWAFDLRNE